MIFDGLFSSLRSFQSRIREKQKEKQRSPKWHRVRDEHLSKHPLCEACGSTEEPQVHHIEPFHLKPELELDPQNLITLCMSPHNCHLLIGHGGSFGTYNPNVLEDSKKFTTASISEKKIIISEAKKSRLK